MPRTGLSRKKTEHMPSDLMQTSTLLQMRLHIGDHLLRYALCLVWLSRAAAKDVTIGTG